MVARGVLIYLVLVCSSLVAALPQPQEEEEQQQVVEVNRDEAPSSSNDEEDQRPIININFIVNVQLPPVEIVVDEESLKYINNITNQEPTLPERYSAVDEGLVSPVKKQGSNCASSVAYASMAVVETCVKRVSGQFQIYSEAQFLSCGWKYHGANGCLPSHLSTYLEWTGNMNNVLVSAEDLKVDGHINCGVSLSQAGPAVVSEALYTYNGTEELLKQMVYDFGAVATKLYFTNETGERSRYYDGKSIFNCNAEDSTDAELGHAVAVVGYDTAEDGTDYWLIKNSGGEEWGDKGFMRLARGTGACGIGKELATVDCITLEQCQEQGCLKAVKRWNDNTSTTPKSETNDEVINPTEEDNQVEDS